MTIGKKLYMNFGIILAMVVVLFLLGAFILLAQSSAIAPFIYTLF